jgi:hypothetical protein
VLILYFKPIQTNCNCISEILNCIRIHLRTMLWVHIIHRGGVGSTMTLNGLFWSILNCLDQLYMYRFQFRFCFRHYSTLWTAHNCLIYRRFLCAQTAAHPWYHVRLFCFGWKLKRVNNENSFPLPLCCLPQNAIVTAFFKDLIVNLLNIANTHIVSAYCIYDVDNSDYKKYVLLLLRQSYTCRKIYLYN